MPTEIEPQSVADDVVRRRLSLWWLLAIVPGFIFVPQLVSLFAFGGAALDPVNGVMRAEVASELVPDLGGAVIAAVVITVLGWWAVVWREPLRTRRWAWALPIALIVASLAFTDWGHLAEVGLAISSVFFVSTFFTGLSEELVFRGIVLQSLRDKTGELTAAVLTSLLFGATHLINALVIGSDAVMQSVLAVGMGYVLYVARRVSGGLLLPILLHWLFDFSLDSHMIGIEDYALGDADFWLFVVQVTVIVAAVVGTPWLRPKPATPQS